MKPGNHSTLRNINKSLVINVIREHGPISRAQVSKITKLTRASISEIVQVLLDERLIVEAGPDDIPIGRKGILLKYNESHGHGICIDLGGTKISIGLFDMNGELLKRKVVKTFQTKNRDEFISKFTMTINQFLEESGKGRKDLIGIGIASPGIIDYNKGIIVEGSPNLPNWENLHLADELNKHFDVPIILENDVRAALVGETWKGSCKNVDSAVLISLGTGIGAGLLMDGNIIRGSGNGAGEIGYMLFERNHLFEDWGNKGCFEYLASGSGMEKMTNSAMSAKEIFQSAASGDNKANEIIDNAIDYLSIAIVNLISIINPEKIILTGSISRSLDVYINRIKENINRHTFTRNRADIVISTLFEEAALYGISILTLSTVKPDIRFLKDISIK